MVITIEGVQGYLQARTDEDTNALACTLAATGYSIRINAIPVDIEYGPGTATLVWKQGDYAGQAVPCV